MRKLLFMMIILSALFIFCSCKPEGVTEIETNGKDKILTTHTEESTQTVPVLLQASVAPSEAVEKLNSSQAANLKEKDTQGETKLERITPAPTSAPTEVQPKLSKKELERIETIKERAVSREIVEIKNGDYFDLDCDGSLEQIQYKRIGKNRYDRDYLLTIGNATLEFYIDDPNEKLYLSHMTRYGESLQILIEDYGPSSDNIVNVFYYQSGVIYDLGDTGGLVEDIKSLGDGIYECMDRANTIQTWFHPRKFYISDEHMNGDDSMKNYSNLITPVLVRMPKEMYPVGTRVVLNCDIHLYRTQRSNIAEVTLFKNQFATLVASDDEEWIYIKGDENGEGWILISELANYKGEDNLSDFRVFSGLCYAD